MLTDVQTPFLGTPVVPLRVRTEGHGFRLPRFQSFEPHIWIRTSIRFRFRLSFRLGLGLGLGVTDGIGTPDLNPKHLYDPLYNMSHRQVTGPAAPRVAGALSVN